MQKTKNKYSYPVDITGNIEVTYDKSPAHVERLRHGVDFIVPIGTEVKAACSGIVVDVKQDSDFGGQDKNYDKDGNYIELKHGNNEYSIYEHIKKSGALVKIGDVVGAGQVIGYSGDTGWIAHLGPHLHFDVHVYFGSGSEDYKTLKIVWEKYSE